MLYYVYSVLYDKNINKIFDYKLKPVRVIKKQRLLKLLQLIINYYYSFTIMLDQVEVQTIITSSLLPGLL